ncbi:dihydrofolate reductase [Telmatospirillum siberiense]|uniref:Dihydrofolate reductase n=1 Tax=Telmatospirillum siberiense TaxID=382514 RepID=A0A2N3PW21_9PROT|nr:dihydrofolate reductase [Telmatospirillum siberiense]PKU24606.1 dihydrofolate reductase [Telmatospirillum siberiense]
MLSLIVAAAANGVIGRDNQLPWHNPEDLRYFKRVTMGKPLVMGRKTHQSIGRPLPGRPNIVVTRDPAWTAEGVHIAHSLEQALDMAGALAAGGEIMVIGGAELFNAALDQADRLYLTEVHRDYEGDVFFPMPDPASWREVSREEHPGDPAYGFVVLERRR